jgi:hypothetical protein
MPVIPHIAARYVFCKLRSNHRRMILDKLLFKSKHWQIFVITLMLTFLNAYFFGLEQGVRGMIGDCLPSILILAWCMLLGSRLMKHLPHHYKTHYMIFIMSGFIMMIGMVVTVIYRNELITFTNFWNGLVISIAFLTIVAAFLGFIARAMKSLQTNDTATVNDYANDVFLWLAWWIGVWFLQPRLNRLYERFYS